MSKILRLALSATAATLLISGLGACDRFSGSSSSEGGIPKSTNELQPVEKLALRLMNTGHIRSVELDGYFLSYKGIPPETLIIMVRVPKDINRSRIQEVIRSAQGVATRMGSEQFGLRSLRVEVDMKDLDKNSS
jgi:hypothetical protein